MVIIVLVYELSEWAEINQVTLEEILAEKLVNRLHAICGSFQVMSFFFICRDIHYSVQEIVNVMTFKAVRTVLHQLYEMNPPQYTWFYKWVRFNWVICVFYLGNLQYHSFRKGLRNLCSWKILVVFSLLIALLQHKGPTMERGFSWNFSR